MSGRAHRADGVERVARDDGHDDRLSELRRRLTNPDAFLTRTDLEELGLARRAVDSVFRNLPVIELPGYSRPLIRVADYIALIDGCTYNDERVRLGRGPRT